MKRLMILGAGGHGRVVREVAEAAGSFESIAFVDDHSPEAVGKLSDLEQLRGEYSCAFVGIGDNLLRGRLLEQLSRLGYEIPVLIHPTAYVSRSCVIAPGTVVEPQAVVNANTHVGVGCIISVGAVVDHDVLLEDWVHVNAGAIVKAGGRVERGVKLEAGQVVMGYGASQKASRTGMTRPAGTERE